MDPSPGLGVASTVAREAPDMLSALGRPERAAPPSREESPARSASGADAGGPATAAAIPPRPDAATAVKDGVTTALWRQADLDVAPVIGHRGTAAVVRSALATARRTHGWLPEPSDDASVDMCVKLLNDTLHGRGAQEAVAAALAVQIAFHSLLGSLVGAELTIQLLGAAWPACPVQGDVLP